MPDEFLSFATDQITHCALFIQSPQPGEHLSDLSLQMDKLSSDAAENGLAELSLQANTLERKFTDASHTPRLVWWCRSGTSSSESLPETAWLRHAWTRRSELVLATTEPTAPRAQGPCLALYCDENGIFSGRQLRGTQIGDAKDIQAGSHAFVCVLGEDFIRATIPGYEFGRACGHGSLSSEQPVLFAGEIELNDLGQLKRWNNISGTYRFPRQHASQAQLPLNSFWGICSPTVESQNSPNWMRVCDGTIWLHNNNQQSDTLEPVTQL
jgi:hypothetical protein